MSQLEPTQGKANKRVPERRLFVNVIVTENYREQFDLWLSRGIKPMAHRNNTTAHDGALAIIRSESFSGAGAITIATSGKAHMNPYY